MKIDFFKNIELNGIFVGDLHQDTLFYGSKLVCEIENFDLKNKNISIAFTRLDRLTAKIIKYRQDSVYNYNFLVSYFSSGDQPKKKKTSSNFLIDYGSLHLSDISFVFRNDQKPHTKGKTIDFSDLEFQHFSGSLSKISIEGDSFAVRVSELSFIEKSGFILKNFTSNILVSPKEITASDFNLCTPRTALTGNFSLRTDSLSDYSHFTEKVVMEARFRDSSYLHSADLAYFAPELSDFSQKIFLSGHLSGTATNLSADQLALRIGKHSAFEGNLKIKGLPDISKLYLDIDADHLSTSYFDLQDFLGAGSSEKKGILPGQLKAMGIMRFEGEAKGYVKNLQINGVISTSLGSIASNANIQYNKGNFSYNGSVKTKNFDLEKLLPNAQVGKLSLDLALNGSGENLNTLKAELKGEIQTVDWKQYSYHNIGINGTFQNKKFNGQILSADSNANFEFAGNVDLKSKIPEATFKLNVHLFDLYKCHLYDDDTVAVFSGDLDIDGKGSNLDELNGNLHSSHLDLKKSNGIIHFDQVNLLIDQSANKNSITLESSLADIDVSGRYSSKTLPGSISNFLQTYFPSFFKPEVGKKTETANGDSLHLKIYTKNMEPLAILLKTPLKISENSILQADFIAGKSYLAISWYSDNILFGKTPVDGWFLSINTKDHQVEMNTGFKRIGLGDSMEISNLNFGMKTKDNKSGLSLTWENLSKKKNSGDIEAEMLFSESRVDLDIEKFKVFIQDSLWIMKGNNHFVADSSGVFNFQNMAFENSGQKLKVEGVISKDPKDQLVISLTAFQLNLMNPILQKGGVQLKGTLSGTTNISDLYRRMIFSSALAFDKLNINASALGKGELNSFYDSKKDVVSINGFFKRDFGKISESAYNNINFDGYYYPSKKDSALDIDVHLHDFAVKALQPFVSGIFTIDEGALNGEVKIQGIGSKPLLSGQLQLDQVRNLKIDYLNTIYSIEGNISIASDEISMDDITLTDSRNQKAHLSGSIFHDNFTNFKLDFDINNKNFTALNTTLLQNSSYYGKAYCSGNIGLYGPPESLIFEINEHTEKGTQLVIPLAAPGEVSDDNFIRFVRLDSLGKKSRNVKGNYSGITLKFNLETTPDAEVQILLDAKGGDMIDARGNGNIALNISTLGEFEMFGTFIIVDGSYTFSLENVLNKKFDIDNGSSIRWSGDPMNADINITAAYKKRASLAPFFPQTQSVSETDPNASSSGGSNATGVDNNKRYLVECKMNMHGKLMKPDIVFGIDLPNVSEVVRSQVMSYISNEQELNRQVFSLLLLQTFVTPLQLSNPSGVSAGSAVGNNASELLSNQLNGWLSHFTKSFNLGLNYRPGSVQSNQEMDVNLSTQLFNDKVSIDGNVGVNNNYMAKTTSLIGDLNVNYKLTRDGRVQMKAFNRSNDNFQIATLGGQFTQGAGVLFREEFNSASDLRRSKLMMAFRHLFFWKKKKDSGKK